MMYKEFEAKVLEGVKTGGPNNMEVTSCSRAKNNGHIRNGLMFHMSGGNVEQSVYLDESYVRYESGQCTIDKVVQDVLKSITICDSFMGAFHFDPNNFESAKGRVAMKLINTEMNQAFLKEVPSLKFYDLSIVFYLLMDVAEDGMGTVQITNVNMDMWGITKKELLESAIKNSKTLLPARFLSMQHTIEDMLNMTDNQKEENLFEEMNADIKDIMYVLTNSIRSQGAACMVYPHVMEMIGEFVKEDYYILPSSLHELIIVPESQAMDIRDMNAMVQEINVTQVEPEEVLGNHAYFYNRSTKKLTY